MMGKTWKRTSLVGEAKSKIRRYMYNRIIERKGGGGENYRKTNKK